MPLLSVAIIGLWATLASAGTGQCPVGLGGIGCKLPLCGGRSKQLRLPPGGHEECKCDGGWEGVNCNVCTDDYICSYLLPESAEPVCLRSGEATSRQMFKSCRIALPDFYKRLIGDDRKPAITMECQGIARDDEDGGFSCDWQFWLESHMQFRCVSKECSVYSPNKTAVTMNCGKLKCECLGPEAELCNVEKKIDLSPVLEVVSGPGTLQCSAGECLLVERTLNDYFGQDGGIRMTCTSGTCLDKSEVPRPPPPVDYTALFAVFGVLLLGFMLFLAALLKRMRVYKNLIESKGAVAGGALLPEDETRLLFESNIATKLAFGKIVYNYKNQKALQGISGMAESGKVMAIIGGSGAGKTTLLEILSGRRQDFEGHVWINSSPMSPDEMQHICGFVDQEDALMPSLTVKESLMYTALLRLPASMSEAAKKLRVDQCMKELGIDHLSEKIVGGSWLLRGLSGGERKRVSIAQALITAPQVLFLDEPTSGLDATSAFKVMEAIVRMTRMYHRTVILSIHQPRSNIFVLIDELLLLGQGRMLYSGEAQQAAAYFGELGFTVPPGFNTADYLVDITMDASIEYSQGLLTIPENQTGLWLEDSEDNLLLDLSEEPSPPDVSWWQSMKDYFSPSQSTQLVHRDSELGKRIEYFEDEYRRSAYFRKLNEGLPSNRASLMSATELIAAAGAAGQKLDYFSQLAILCSRTWVNLKRDPALLQSHYMLTVLMALILGALFWKVENDMAGVQNRMGCLFFTCAFFAFSSLTALDAFGAGERHFFAKERFYCNASMYYVAKVLFDLFPLRLLPPIAFGCIVYPMIGLYWDIWVFLRFLLAITLFNFTVSLISTSIGVTFKSKGVASLFSSLAILFGILFGGFLLNKQHLPLVFRWLTYFSYFNYGFEALVVNEISHIILHDNSIIDIEVPGSLILRQFGFSSDAYWMDVFLLVIMALASACLGLIAMVRIKNE